MELNEYQDSAISTCTNESYNYSYMMGNLQAEVGEFAGKVNKAQRKKEVVFVEGGDFNWNYDQEPSEQKAFEFNLELKKEAGDILWQLSGLCHVMGWKLEDVAKLNLAKLASRKARGVIVREGDNR